MPDDSSRQAAAPEQLETALAALGRLVTALGAEDETGRSGSPSTQPGPALRPDPAGDIAGAGLTAQQRRLRWHLDEYLLPRVRDLGAPLVVVLLGSTGAGKSSLTNGLAGRRVSPSGVTRPTTRRPAVLVDPTDEGAFLSGRVLGAMARAGRLDLVVDSGGFAGVALVDAPDLDSVEAANRAAADELLQAADLVLFVTTAQRYADAVPWDVLMRARDRGVPLVVVVNRLPADPVDRQAVMDDCRRRFEEAGLGDVGPGGALEVLPVLEGERDPAVDGLDAAALAPLRARLAELGPDGTDADVGNAGVISGGSRTAGTAGGVGAAARAVRVQALRGALDGLPGTVDALAGAVEAAERRAAGLRAVIDRAYGAAANGVEDRLADGVFLRGEVMRAWQDFVGAGSINRALATGVGRVRLWLADRGRGPGAAPPLEDAKEQAFAELGATLGQAADPAAAASAQDWTSDPNSAGRIADRPELWGHGQELPGRAREELHRWLGGLTTQVRTRGRNRRTTALGAALGVNAVGVAAMLVVFSQSAGLTGGEVAIAGGTAVVTQKLLEALFGEAAAADMVRRAGQDLRVTLRRLLDGDAERFLALVPPPAVSPDELRAAAGRVTSAAAALGGDRQGGDRQGGDRQGGDRQGGDARTGNS